MQLKKGEIVELEIDALAFGGAGIGSYEGMKFFVKKTMPGDKVKASLKKIKKSYGEADLVEIVEPSKDRIEEKCKHAKVCGGCQMQFVPYDQQLEHKKRHVEDCFTRIGGFDDVEVEEILGCEEEFYYRNKMEFSFGYDENMRFTLGMHVPGRRFDIMDLEECHLESQESAEIVNLSRKFFFKLGWKPFKYSNGSGFLKHLIIREGKRSGERMVVVKTADKLPKGFEEGMKKFVEMVEDYCSTVYWTKDISRRGHRRVTEHKLLYGKQALTEEMIVGDETYYFDIAPGAFFQVNTLQAEKLYEEVVDLVNLGEHKTVFDLFCGTGTIGMFLAKNVEKVVGVEINEGAVKAAVANAEKNEIMNIEFYCGDVGKVLEELSDRPDLIVLDPPRAGLTGKMIEEVLKFDVDRIVYVSCNPSTLARDCSVFAEAGYKVKKVKPVDMFPHTFHIETVCLLER